jgi:hypothetical protein
VVLLIFIQHKKLIRVSEVLISLIFKRNRIKRRRTRNYSIFSEIYSVEIKTELLIVLSYEARMAKMRY